MEKNEQISKIDELRNAVSNRDFEKAASIADELELKKIKDNNFLSLVADVYELLRMYDKAKKVLLIAYENTNAGRNLAYRLCLVSVKTKEFDEAKEFYEDFVEMAPRDTGRYILKYKMAKGQNASPEKLIQILEEYVNIDMEEKWAYELAKLYHMVGEEEKCIDMCDEVSLWFSEGKYVLKAMELKKMYQPLTATQQQKYDRAYEKQNELSAQTEEKQENETKAQNVEENIIEDSTEVVNEDESVWFDEEDEVKEVEETPFFPEIEIKADDPSRFNTIDMQAVIAHGMKEVEMEEIKEETSEESNEEISKDSGEENMETPVEAEIKTETEEVVINDINDVQDILRELQERGILKAETVDKAVSIIGGEKQEDEKEETVEDIINELNKDVIVESIKDTTEKEVNETVDGETDNSNEKSEKREDFGATKEFSSKLTETPTDILEQPTCAIPDVKDIIKPKEVIEASVPNNAVPVFDLSFSEVAPPEDVKVDKSLNEVEKQEQPDVVETAEDEENIQEETENIVEEKVVDDKIQLTDEELVAFKNYVNVEGFETNIKEVLTDLVSNYEPNGKSETGNVMILGDEKTGKTTLAIELIKLVNKKRGRRNRRLVKVDAVALNRRGFRNALNKLIGSDLIIENANVLGAMTISEIIDVCCMYTDDMLIVLEGDGDGMDILIKNTPRISEVFNHVVRIREYDIKEWVDYGIEYATNQGYVLDELANLAFYKVIDDFFGEHKGIGQSDVEAIIDEAISRSGRLGRKLFGNKKNEEGFAILVEKDFNV